MKDKVFAWLQLVRLPNIFTVPGDVLVGYFVVSYLIFPPSEITNIFFAVLSATLLYVFGLISNDIADYEIDSRERPERPLPSGRISISNARVVAIVSLISGLGSAYLIGPKTLAVALVMTAVICLYNFKLKKHRIAGPLLLACCRTLSVCLGISAVGYGYADYWTLIKILPVTFFYIYGVSKLAQNETADNPPQHGRIEIAVSLSFVIYGLIVVGGQWVATPEEFRPDGFPILLGCVLYLVFLLNGFWNGVKVIKDLSPDSVQNRVGSLIRNIMLFQVAWCAFTGNILLSAILIFMMQLSEVTASKFYST